VGISSFTLPASSVYVNVNAEDSGATLNENLLGTNFLTPGPGVPIMKQIGIVNSRITAALDGTYNSTPIYNCQNAQWDSQPLDEMVQTAYQAGAVPEVIIQGMPHCLDEDAPGGANPSNYVPDPGLHTQMWNTLIFELGMHEISEGVRYFEIWNEPDWFYFWSGTESQYLSLYQETSLDLEKAALFSHIKIYVGGPTMANVLSVLDTNWLGPFLSFVASNHLPLDFLSWHLYPNDPLAGPLSQGGSPLCFGQPPGPGTNLCYYNHVLTAGAFMATVNTAKQMLANYPSLHPQIFIDEWNVDAEYDPREDTSYDAAFSMAVLQGCDETGVARMDYYDMVDGSFSTFGMLNENYGLKPVAYAFSFFHAAAGNIISSGTYPEQYPEGSGGIGVISTKNSAGVIHVIIYNFVPYDPTGTYGPTPVNQYNKNVFVAVSGLTAFGYNASISRIGYGEAPFYSAQVNVNGSVAYMQSYVPEEGVIMLTLTPN
jgi:hypothetical protein